MKRIVDNNKNESFKFTTRNYIPAFHMEHLAEFQPPFVGSIDQGTTSSRFILFDSHGHVVTYCQKEFPSIYPEAGWCEQDPMVLWQSVEACIEGALGKFEAMGFRKEQIEAVGITNQRETTVVWDKQTGEPLHHALVWLDVRTSGTVASMIQQTPNKSKDDLRVCPRYEHCQ